jgi:hypothetical protein
MRALLLLSFLTGCSGPQRSPPLRPAQIILIRHGEEPADPNDPHLSPEGIKRAQDLVPFITTDPEMTRYGAPVTLFATRTTKHDTGVRTQETLVPLAQVLKLRVQTPFLGSQYAEMARAILLNPLYAGKTVLVCWNHENIPQLTYALGVTREPEKWKGKVFDLVYIISYQNGVATLRTARYGAMSSLSGGG